MSPAYFSRYFKRVCGCSFYEFVRNARMERAMALLKTNRKKIKPYLSEEIWFYFSHRRRWGTTIRRTFIRFFSNTRGKRLLNSGAPLKTNRRAARPFYKVFQQKKMEKRSDRLRWEKIKPYFCQRGAVDGNFCLAVVLIAALTIHFTRLRRALIGQGPYLRSV